MCNQQFSSDFAGNTQGVGGINAIFRDYALPGGNKGARATPAASVAASTSTLLTPKLPAAGRDPLLVDSTPMNLNRLTLLGM